jgi:3-hydroxyisobutyrate dehydrogenase-like beta-hydroxyacid dehydrogenase
MAESGVLGFIGLGRMGRPMARRLMEAGQEPGQAQAVKLANILLAAAAPAVSAEAIVMGVKAGLDPRLMSEVINAGSGRNCATFGPVSSSTSIVRTVEQRAGVEARG